MDQVQRVVADACGRALGDVGRAQSGRCDHRVEGASSMAAAHVQCSGGCFVRQSTSVLFACDSRCGVYLISVDLLLPAGCS
jgi:hypothetical protein